MEIGTILEARADRYARRLGTFTLRGSVVRLGSASEVWNFVRACGGRNFRVLYRCLDGTARDLIGRQGVYKSSQDGTVAGIGHAMANAERLNLSFWTATHGSKVNTGSGKGYRTLRAAGILALRVDGVDILTDAGLLAISEVIETVT
jgi:hypothetical protein